MLAMTNAQTKNTETSSTASAPSSMQASFSLLLMSIASNALMAMGLSPHPETQKTEVDRGLAKFNIDLLLILKEKSEGKRTDEENQFLNAILSDLQSKFVQLKA